MTIDEAIKLLSTRPITDGSEYIKKVIEAMNLGIEALKAYQYYRSQNLQGLLPNLPSETNE